MIPTKGLIESAQNFVVRNIHHKLWQLLLLLRVVNAEVLPEVSELIDSFVSLNEEVGKFIKLSHELE